MDHAVLLYYKYVDLSAKQAEVAQWMLELCTSLELKGRIRVALDGVNVTVRTHKSPTGVVQWHCTLAP